jgi:hypothetical protein
MPRPRAKFTGEGRGDRREPGVDPVNAVVSRHDDGVSCVEPPYHQTKVVRQGDAQYQPRQARPGTLLASKPVASAPGGVIAPAVPHHPAAAAWSAYAEIDRSWSGAVLLG